MPKTIEVGDGVSGTLIETMYDEFNDWGYDPTGPEAGAGFRPYDDMGIFEDYDGPDNPNALPQEYLDSMDRMYEAFEEERRAEMARPNYEPMKIAQKIVLEQEFNSQVPNAMSEKFFKAFNK